VRTRPSASTGCFHPGVAGELVLALPAGPVVVGCFGELHPEVRNKLGVTGPAFAFDLDLTKLPLAGPRQMRSIPRFPGSDRDVSLLLSERVSAARVEEVIEQAHESLVYKVRLVEDYRDAKLGEGMKSMLWSIGYRAPDRTLTDAEIDKAHETIVGRLVDNLPAQRR
jgi:phenylalanyl-tRNA synthetase beta chain